LSILNKTGRPITFSFDIISLRFFIKLVSEVVSHFEMSMSGFKNSTMSFGVKSLLGCDDIFILEIQLPFTLIVHPKMISPAVVFLRASNYRSSDFLSLIECYQFVWQQFLPAGCASRKTVSAVVNDGLDLETVMHPAALQSREP
jgi:hypothetical protein